MPLTTKGEKILSAMRQTYKHKGGDKKAKEVFYASRNKGTIKGVDPESKTAAYEQGFADRCKQVGIDPRAIKQAGPLTNAALTAWKDVGKAGLRGLTGLPKHELAGVTNEGAVLREQFKNDIRQALGKTRAVFDKATP